MSTIPLQGTRTMAASPTRPLDMKLEVIVVPVADVDRAIDFYTAKPLSS